MCGYCARPLDIPVRKDWLVVVPVRDAHRRIVRWIPRMVIPNQSLIEALEIARSEYGPEADVREHALSFRP